MTASTTTEFVDWLVDILTGRGAPAPAVRLALTHYAEALRDFPRAARFLDAGRKAVAAR